MKQEYYHTPESVAEYINMAKDVNGQEIIDKLNSHLSKGAHILELGSGPGSDWEILNASYKTTGSDNSKEFLKYLKSQNPKGDFLELDAITIETKIRFDCIYSNKVLQHLSNEQLEKSVSKQHQILNPGGVICHSFWKGKGHEYYNGLLVQYQNKESLKKLFEPHFRILNLEEYKEFDEGDSILLIAKAK